ncbi:MAG: efflux transporter outer membrane subunit [Burkholderiales bacterium]|nr:efflux transporter outer membrane subunit [Burkholderiales bacterium]
MAGRSRWAAALVFAFAILAGCSAGPAYRRPQPPLPAAYKEDGIWRVAQPQRIDADHPWWTLYADPALDALMARLDAANNSIAVAAAQYRQARAVAAAANAAWFPSVGVNAGYSRGLGNGGAMRAGDAASIGLAASWEPDLWGSVERAVEAGRAGAAASADNLAAARLSTQALLAQDYFQLRAQDRQIALYERSIRAYRKALEMAQHQYAAGVALRSDVANAQAQLEGADAQRIDLVLQRAQLEHAIAILVGRAPADFRLAADPARAETLPALPALVPSELLQRRPDIAAAERLAAQANANVGVAAAAWFPTRALGASAGYAGYDLRHLFDAPARVWSLGAALAGSLFDGGLRRARSEQALGAWDAAVAQYRATVLGGFQEVEDNLAALHWLGQELQAQDRAVASARLAERLALEQYKAGTANYLAVVVAQTTALGDERTAVQLRARRQIASVTLIKATGGGWTAVPPAATNATTATTAATVASTTATSPPPATPAPATASPNRQP